MRWPEHIKVVRTLRFRLASTFMLLMAVVLASSGLAVTATLRFVLNTGSEQILRDELGALKGYLHFDEQDGNPYWFADRSDPEELQTVARLSTGR
jgi:hypothetical protein